MQEKRSVSRRRTFYQGVLSFQNGNVSQDCVIRDLAERGAQIELPHPHAPDVFDLQIPARGMLASARVVWRNGLRLGVEFAPTERASAPRRVAGRSHDACY